MRRYPGARSRYNVPFFFSFATNCIFRTSITKNSQPTHYAIALFRSIQWHCAYAFTIIERWTTGQQVVCSWFISLIFSNHDLIIIIIIRCYCRRIWGVIEMKDCFYQFNLHVFFVCVIAGFVDMFYPRLVFLKLFLLEMRLKWMRPNDSAFNS